MLIGINKILNFEEKKDVSIQFWNLVGPIFIVLTLFLTSFSSVSNKDLFLISVVGLALCWKRKQRGLIYSIIFLVVLIFIKHFHISDNHIWQLGLELSLLLGFVISYLSLEHTSEYIKMLDESKNKHMSDMSKLEEELKKEEDFHQRQHKNFKYEIERVNLQLEEKRKEIDSFKNLVQSLRDAAKENESHRMGLVSQIKDKEQKTSVLRQEIEDMKAHILTLENQEQLNQRNKKLLDELNSLRVDKEQSHSINQSLAKMLSKEVETKKEREKENQSLFERINISESKILSMQNEISTLQEAVTRKNTELSQAFASKVSFAEQTNETAKALSSSVSSADQINEKELLVQYEKRYQDLKKSEALYKQMKKQFEDKQTVLSDTRKELFLAKEELEKIRKDKKMNELDETEEVRELYLQIGEFEEEIVRLEEENIDMQDIVSVTINQDFMSKVKDVDSSLKRKMKDDQQLPLSLE